MLNKIMYTHDRIRQNHVLFLKISSNRKPKKTNIPANHLDLSLVYSVMLKLGRSEKLAIQMSYMYKEKERSLTSVNTGSISGAGLH